MIVVDSSALVAILLNEPERRDMLEMLLGAGKIAISAVAVLETHMVVSKQPGRAAALDELLTQHQIQMVPVDASQIEFARAAFDRFGKGRHRARLNFGDCLSYALAKSLGAPLLYKGDDFAATDIVSAFRA